MTFDELRDHHNHPHHPDHNHHHYQCTPHLHYNSNHLSELTACKVYGLPKVTSNHHLVKCEQQ